MSPRLLLALLCSITTQGASPSPDAEALQRLRAVLASPDLDAIRHSNRATVVRLEKMGERDYRVRPVGAEIDLDPTARDGVRDVLLSEGSYAPDMHSLCLFDPGVELRFWSARTGCAAVQICFKCSELVFKDPDGRRIGDVVVFSRGRPFLVAFAKKTFPNDPDIQGLSPTLPGLN